MDCRGDQIPDDEGAVYTKAISDAEGAEKQVRGNGTMTSSKMEFRRAHVEISEETSSADEPETEKAGMQILCRTALAEARREGQFLVSHTALSAARAGADVQHKDPG